MRLLVALCFVGVALSVPRPAFRYAYMIPQAGESQPWSQFNERSDDHYAWGYEYPGRAHFESKDTEGVVKGSFGYVNANGAPVVWQYSSHPNTGFHVNTGTGEVLPQVPEAVKEHRLIAPIPLTYAQVVDEAVSPLLKAAADAGDIVPAGNTLSGTPQYAVNPEIAEEVGGVSALAKRLGAIPVAAVHDVQRKPSFSESDSAFAPVLNHREEPGITLYTLEVPIE